MLVTPARSVNRTHDPLDPLPPQAQNQVIARIGAAMTADRHEKLSLDLWARYNAAHADLVRARRAFREGRATETEILRHQAALEDVHIELGFLGELAP